MRDKKRGGRREIREKGERKYKKRDKWRRKEGEIRKRRLGDSDRDNKRREIDEIKYKEITRKRR